MMYEMVFSSLGLTTFSRALTRRLVVLSAWGGREPGRGRREGRWAGRRNGGGAGGRGGGREGEYTRCSPIVWAPCVETQAPEPLSAPHMATSLPAFTANPPAPPSRPPPIRAHEAPLPALSAAPCLVEGHEGRLEVGQLHQQLDGGDVGLAARLDLLPALAQAWGGARVCVCVCVCKNERERELSERERERERECVCVCKGPCRPPVATAPARGGHL